MAKLHGKLRATPYQANRVLAVIGSMYVFANLIGAVPEGFNPSQRIEKLKEERRERFLTGDELERLGAAIREAETVGIPWDVNETTPPCEAPREIRQALHEDRAVHCCGNPRLLLFTGCRLREILHLRWQYVDLERGLIFFPDSKSGRKTVILNAPAMAVLADISPSSVRRLDKLVR